VVTIFELIAVPGMILPLILSTMTAVMASQFIAPSIYESILVMKKLPCLPTLSIRHRADRCVREVMRDVTKLAIKRDMKWEDLRNVHRRLEANKLNIAVPIVERVNGKYLLLGCIPQEVLREVAANPSMHSVPQSRLSLCPTGSTKRDKGLSNPSPDDLLRLFATRGDLVSTHQVDVFDSVRDIYIEAQAMHYDRTMMVVHNGFLEGMLTFEDLLKLV